MWQLKITSDKQLVRSDNELIELQFICNEDNVYSSYDDLTPIVSVSKSISYKLPKGSYTFRFQKNGFNELIKSVELNQAQQINIVLEKGGTTNKFALPGIVRIVSDPSNAEVLINSQKVGNTPYQTELTSGTHQLEIRKPLYYSDISSFMLEEGKTVTLQRTLKPKFGLLTVTSPIKGSRLYIDNKMIDTLPVKNQNLESSEHIVRVEAPFYHTYFDTIKINDGDRKILDVKLEPAFGSLFVYSNPENNSEVSLDGRKVGITPLRLPQLSSGKYLLRVSKEFFNDNEEYIEIKDGITLTKTVILNQNYGEVEIIAPESRIIVDAKLVGNGTFSGRLTPGKHTVKADRGEQYYLKEEEIFLSIGEKKKITLETEGKIGGVSIFAEPEEVSDAEIYVNGEMKGNAPLVIPLLIGKYSITAKKTNYLDAIEQIEIEENVKKSLTFTLLTYEGSRLQLKNKWGTVKWIAAGTALISAGTGVYFLLASDNHYDEYKSAHSTTQAVDLRHKSVSELNLGKTLLYVATATASAALISWIVQSVL